MFCCVYVGGAHSCVFAYLWKPEDIFGCDVLDAIHLFSWDRIYSWNSFSWLIWLTSKYNCCTCLSSSPGKALQVLTTLASFHKCLLRTKFKPLCLQVKLFTNRAVNRGPVDYLCSYPTLDNRCSFKMASVDILKWLWLRCAWLFVPVSPYYMNQIWSQPFLKWSSSFDR